MKSVRRALAVFFVLFLLMACVVSMFWPAYDWAIKVPSPDGRYDIAVLREDAVAFADYSYRVYVFPHSVTPQHIVKGTRVWPPEVWLHAKYLAYSGYNLPAFRWTGSRSIEIDLNDLIPTVCSFEPVKLFEASNEPVLISLEFGKENVANSLP